MPMFLRPFSVIVIICFIILFVGCAVNAFAPKWCWKTFESWKAKEEPTAAYFLVKRISGIIGMIVIAVIALMPTVIAYFDK